MREDWVKRILINSLSRWKGAVVGYLKILRDKEKMISWYSILKHIIPKWSKFQSHFSFLPILRSDHFYEFNNKPSLMLYWNEFRAYRRLQDSIIDSRSAWITHNIWWAHIGRYKREGSNHLKICWMINWICFFWRIV